MNLQDLQRDLQVKLDRQDVLLSLTDTEQRDFTDVENTEFDTLTREVKAIQTNIQAEQKKDEARANIAMAKMNQTKQTEEQKVSKSFSLLRAIRLKAEGKELDGAEREIHEEAVREAKEAGRTVSGFGLPSFMVRAQDAATAATAGNLIATNLDSTLIPALRPKTFSSTLGATMMTGLTGNLDLPAGDAIASAAWEGENDENASTDPSTRLVSLRPNRLGAFTTVSKQLIMQSSFSVENWIRAELSDAIARAVDSAVISGNSANINGILATSGVNEISFAGAPTRAKLIDMQTKIAVENAVEQNLAYLMNPRAKGDLRSLETDSGSGLFVMDNNDTLLGYKVATSTLVPTNIASTKTAIIFGNWADLIIAQWGGVDLLIDPYTLATKEQIRIITNSYWDVELKNAKSFVFGDDATYAALS